MTVFTMSRPEIDRVHVLRDVVAERISVREVAQLLRITRRQVCRLKSLPGVPTWVVADRGYTSHASREPVWSMGARPAIPRRHSALVRKTFGERPRLRWLRASFTPTRYAHILCAYAL